MVIFVRRNLKNCRMQIINPATEEIIAEVPEDTQASVAEKYRLLLGG